ncbi:MAG: DUF1501 domain-containing protein, partial [Planctomycetaceae bacterium]
MDRNNQHALNRRHLLRSGGGFGSLAVAALMQEAGRARELPETRRSPLSARSTHFPPRAKRVIFLFMSGGPSQMDLFDYKPQLAARAGQAIPYKLPGNEATVGLDNTTLLGPTAEFRHAGESGLFMS